MARIYSNADGSYFQNDPICNQLTVHFNDENTKNKTEFDQYKTNRDNDIVEPRAPTINDTNNQPHYQKQFTSFLKNIVINENAANERRATSFNVKNKYSTFIEMGNPNDLVNHKLINRSIHVEPSPSGITRIHINHFNSDNKVMGKIKEVNERARIFESKSDTSIDSENKSTVFNQPGGEQQQTQTQAESNMKNSSTSPILVFRPSGANQEQLESTRYKPSLKTQGLFNKNFNLVFIK
jgi:hypothetical protein